MKLESMFHTTSFVLQVKNLLVICVKSEQFVIIPRLIPNLSYQLRRVGAKQFVVQDAFDNNVVVCSIVFIFVNTHNNGNIFNRLLERK